MNTTATDIQAIIQTLAGNFESALKQGDAAGLAEFYSDNGMLLPPGFDFVQGRRDIETFWQGAMDMGIKNARLKLVEVEQHGDTAIEISKYVLSDKDENVIDSGKGLVIWKFNGSNWKMHRDIWNSSLT